MDRRLFLKLTGLAAAASALEALPVAAERLPEAGLAARALGPERVPVSSVRRFAIREPGIYQIAGRVRLLEPEVEIRGLAHTQRISWSHIDGPDGPETGFSIYQQFDTPGVMPEVRVLGGRLQSLTVVPMIFD